MRLGKLEIGDRVRTSGGQVGRTKWKAEFTENWWVDYEGEHGGLYWSEEDLTYIGEKDEEESYG